MTIILNCNVFTIALEADFWIDSQNMYAFKKNIYFNLSVFNFPFEHSLFMAVVAVPSDGQQGEHTPCKYRKRLQVADWKVSKAPFFKIKDNYG